VNARAWTTYGPTHYILGRLAALRGDLDVAVARLERAIEASTRLSAWPRVALAQESLARVLDERAADGDGTRAAELHELVATGPWTVPVRAFIG
jgi:hypothetical protein